MTVRGSKYDTPILMLLADSRERTFQEIVDRLGADTSRIHRRLHHMLRAGVVTRSRIKVDGRFWFLWREAPEA